MRNLHLASAQAALFKAIQKIQISKSSSENTLPWDQKRKELIETLKNIIQSINEFPDVVAENSDDNVQDDPVSKLRSSLLGMIKECERSDKSENSQFICQLIPLRDAVLIGDDLHEALLAIARYHPCNSRDPISQENIDPYHQVVISTGHQLDSLQLYQWHDSIRKSRELRNPLTNAPFDDRDYETIIKQLESMSLGFSNLIPNPITESRMSALPGHFQFWASNSEHNKVIVYLQTFGFSVSSIAAFTVNKLDQLYNHFKMILELDKKGIMHGLELCRLNSDEVKKLFKIKDLISAIKNNAPGFNAVDFLNCNQYVIGLACKNPKKFSICLVRLRWRVMDFAKFNIGNQFKLLEYPDQFSSLFSILELTAERASKLPLFVFECICAYSKVVSKVQEADQHGSLSITALRGILLMPKAIIVRLEEVLRVDGEFKTKLLNEFFALKYLTLQNASVLIYLLEKRLNLFLELHMSFSDSDQFSWTTDVGVLKQIQTMLINAQSILQREKSRTCLGKKEIAKIALLEGIQKALLTDDSFYLERMSNKEKKLALNVGGCCGFFEDHSISDLYQVCQDYFSKSPQYQVPEISNASVAEMSSAS